MRITSIFMQIPQQNTYFVFSPYEKYAIIIVLSIIEAADQVALMKKCICKHRAYIRRLESEEYNANKKT